ncbi:CMD domain protein [Rubellimicrobium arenae]|uniref:CMD domain protein n=1 Tax=Rubellimicrobium arenae TaxID=2817372 RepID=UPI001B312E82|nr:CMD domain protein [Rubellimicrobium arenae]
MTDLITRLSGLSVGSPEDRAFANRAEARRQSEDSYLLLLHPADSGPVSLVERRAVAAFVAVLHQQPETAAHYRALLEGTDSVLAPTVLRLAESARGPGPWGRYPSGPLSHEDQPGAPFRLTREQRDAIGLRLAAALEHAHLLTLHPRDASRDALQALLDAGWTTPGIVTLSQLVAFLAFQIRVVAGLTVLQAARSAVPA